MFSCSNAGWGLLHERETIVEARCYAVGGRFDPVLLHGRIEQN
jgi:ethanolamine ammonia-lyase large subunit